MVNTVAIIFAAIALEAVSTVAIPVDGPLMARARTGKSSGKKTSASAKGPASKGRTGRVLNALQKNPDAARAGASALGSLANIGLQAYQVHEQAKYGGGGTRRELIARAPTKSGSSKKGNSGRKSRTGQVVKALEKNPDLARAGASALSSLANVGLQAYQTHQQAKYGGGTGSQRRDSWDDLDELD